MFEIENILLWINLMPSAIEFGSQNRFGTANFGDVATEVAKCAKFFKDLEMKPIQCWKSPSLKITLNPPMALQSCADLT
ncbi:hypothetical protein CEXT_730181 [Caerostris extrusa]|uniref:Uncharacterized protein n=1 Tax=Caerostris extrusa TaxID=172846 RepID=A0AAV4V6E6_CAEEX|nr:hypothetical protein CEXT_730181 [Caerostris extrusa]